MRALLFLCFVVAAFAQCSTLVRSFSCSRNGNGVCTTATLSPTLSVSAGDIFIFTCEANAGGGANGPENYPIATTYSWLGTIVSSTLQQNLRVIVGVATSATSGLTSLNLGQETSNNDIACVAQQWSGLSSTGPAPTFSNSNDPSPITPTGAPSRVFIAYGGNKGNSNPTMTTPSPFTLADALNFGDRAVYMASTSVSTTAQINPGPVVPSTTVNPDNSITLALVENCIVASE